MNVNNFFKILNYDEVKDFGRNQKNRLVEHKHQKEIVDTIKGKTFNSEQLVFGLNPIIINPITKHILDGQHRWSAFIYCIEKNLINSDAHVLIGLWNCKEDEEIEIVQLLNTKTKNWSLNDYMESYSTYDTSFNMLKMFCSMEEHPYLHKKITVKSDEDKNKTVIKKANYRYGAVLMKGKGCQAVLKNGTFDCSKDEFETAMSLYPEVIAIMEAFGYTKIGTWFEALTISWIKYRNKIDVNIFTSDKKKYQDIISKASKYTIVSKTQNDWDDAFRYIIEKINL